MLEKTTDFLFGALGCLWMILLMALGLGYAWLGVVGIEHHLGWGWALGAILLVFLARITLPITIGVYFAVVDVIGWPWWAGLLIAAPGIVLIVPANVASAVGAISDRLRR